jgi:hypothetical protein
MYGYHTASLILLIAPNRLVHVNQDGSIRGKVVMVVAKRRIFDWFGNKASFC